jgi:hypothetical protein
MNPRLLLASAALSCVLAGCGGSDVGAPQPVPVASFTPAPVAFDQAATFVVRVGEGDGTQRFVVKITDPSTLEVARRSMNGELQTRPIVTGELRAGGGGFNRDPFTGRVWNWHLDPSTVRFVDNSVEIYDGRPTDIEDDLPYWLNKMGRYAPWGNVFEREITKPKGK